LQAALTYIEAGWFPVPVPYKGKGPQTPGWPELRLTAETAPKYFNGTRQNIGVLLGLDNRIDIDLDSSEAIACASHFLPVTSATFGRASKRLSHWLYRVTDLDTVSDNRIAIEDPAPGAGKAMLVEMRLKGGHQTIVPPSIHESGEPIEWENGWPVVPAEVSFKDLRRAVRRVAAASLLARHMPASDKARQKAFCAIAGFLSKWHWPVEQAGLFARAVTAAGHFDRGPYYKAYETALAHSRGENVPGYPALVEHFGQLIADTVIGWLRCQNIKLCMPFSSAAVAAPSGPDRPIIAREQDYVRAAVVGECAEAACAAEGTRNARLHKAAVKLGTLVGAGLLAEGDAETELFEAGVTAGLRRSEVTATIKSGLGYGTEHPRERPKLTDDFVRGENRHILTGHPHNTRLAIKLLGVTLRLNEFSTQTEVAGLSGFEGELTDAGAIRLRFLIQEKFGFLPSLQIFEHALVDIAHAARFHPVRDWLDGLEWDGVPRIGGWLMTYAGAEDTEFNRAVGKIFFVAGVRRVRQPGCKFDTMLVLESRQGKNKSKTLKALAVRDVVVHRQLTAQCRP
jgi:hypothetical protein